jgi:hypothetical protein
MIGYPIVQPDAIQIDGDIIYQDFYAILRCLTELFPVFGIDVIRGRKRSGIHALNQEKHGASTSGGHQGLQLQTKYLTCGTPCRTAARQN